MPDIFQLPKQRAVTLSKELTRIARMPRRTWDEERTAWVVREMTDALKTPHGTMTLKPEQAIGLYELGTVGGMLAPIRCGGGKTLLSLLAGTVMFAKRYLLIVPASLLDKTERDRKELAQHWDVPDFMKMVSYEWLGRAQAAEFLEQFCPDVIGLDESHKAKNRNAAVTRRLIRFFREHPQTRAFAMSGTFTKRSLFDYAHIAQWCLHRTKQPLPQDYDDLELWADALDERKEHREENRADPGALLVLCNDEEKEIWKTDSRTAARKAFRRRLVETPGVVASFETPIDASLTIRAVTTSMRSDTDDAFKKLRTEWETPDGWPISDGMTMARHARELALGLYYVWSPRPPKHWLDARKKWCKFVRETIKHSRKYDSELQVRNAFSGVEECLEWLAVADDFEPNTHAVWIDDSALQFAADWAQRNVGIVWTHHQCFAERLSHDFGLPYYGKKGKTADGRMIEEHPADSSIVASVRANATGRNLQAWNLNLHTSPMPNGLEWEQLLSRTHRDGQKADEVVVEFLMTCVEHREAVQQALSDCEYVQVSHGAPQKLLLAGIDVPPAGTQLGHGPRWNK
jgi:hypothetical protein